jgi:hypothetical protein
MLTALKTELRHKQRSCAKGAPPSVMPKQAQQEMLDDLAGESSPVLIMVVDSELQVLELNAAAAEFVAPGQGKEALKCAGDVFRCTQCTSESVECGGARFCNICPIREAASLAGRENRVVRRRTKAEVGLPGHQHEVHLLVTAIPLPTEPAGRTLLVMEDITSLVELQDPAPICACCRRIRDDDHYWERVDAHFRRHLDVELSAEVCPECKSKLYGNLLGGPSRGSGKRS